MNLHATQLANKADSDVGTPGSPVVSVSGPPGRFTYASGARPLQGYTIKRGIGHGGFGEVYYAASDAGKEVALKLIRRNWDIELRGVTQCLNLKHPNLLALYDVRQDDNDDNWVVMELMAGESLEDVLQRHPDGLPVEETLAWMHGIAAGVAYLHDHGIVHRDLKPGNIFVDEGIVKIGDYGLSKFISCSRRSGQTGSVGTVHYMAPEVANGRYGKEIDIYALGVMLYEMLTGHVPFEGESVGEILMKHLTAEPDVSRLAEPYRTIVARALAKDPARRFASVGEMLEMLPPAPIGVALTASARFAGPNVAVIQNATKVLDNTPPTPAGRPGLADDPTNAAPPEVFSASLPVSPPLPKPSSDEPILRWINETWNDLAAWWERMNFQPWQKLLILFGVSLAAFKLMPLWLPTLIVATIGYIAYRMVRATVGYMRSPCKSNSQRKSPDEDAAPNVPQANAAGSIPVARSNFHESRTRWRWRQQTTMPFYDPGPPRERAAKLLESMLTSAIVVAVMSLVMGILRGVELEPSQYAWLTATSLLGTWAVLLPAKLWEGTHVDNAVRRFVLLVVGLAVGMASYGVIQWLMVGLPFDSEIPDLSSEGPARGLRNDFFSPDGSPRMIALLAYYGFLFVVVRWWKLADPLRNTRLSLWAVAVAVFWSFVVNLFWPFPQPWGMMTAATIAVAVQMASPCVAKPRRLANGQGGG